MFDNQRKHKPRGIHFEIIPMIDVMMILVLFLSVMAFLPQVQSSIKPDVPKGGTDNELSGDDVIVSLKIVPGTGQVELRLNDEPLADSDLVPRIKDLIKDKPQTKVAIAADKTISYDQVIQLLLKFKREKISNVVLATAKSESGPAAP